MVEVFTHSQTDPRRIRFLEALSRGAAIVAAAREGGVTVTSLYRWRHADRDFRATWDLAYAAGSDALRLRGFEGSARGVRAAAGQAPLTAAIADEIGCGRCKTPGCSNPNCPYRAGECHCGCGSPAPIADQSDRKHGRVIGKPCLYAVGHNRSGNTLMAASEGEPLIDAITRAGLTRQGLSFRADLGKGTLGTLIDIEGERLHRDRCQRVVDVLREEYERLGLDPSELTLEALFTEERPATEKPGERRHRPRNRRRPPVPPEKRGDGGRYFRERVKDGEAAIKAAGLLTRRQVLEALPGYELHQLVPLHQNGRLPYAETFEVGFTTMYGYDPRTLKRFQQKLRTSDRAWDVRRRDPLLVQSWAMSRGASAQRALELAKAATARTELAKRVRVDTGRPKSEGPPAYHFDWAERFRELKAEQDAQHAFDVENGFHDPPPTNLGVALLVAEEDFAEYPDRWDYDPSTEPYKASRRVWKAVKTLLTAVTETRMA